MFNEKWEWYKSSNNEPSGNCVTSWNDLKDKPFYEVPPIEAEVVPETTANFEYNNTNRYYGESPVSGDVSFNLEKTYTVVWDGEIYDNVPCVDTMGGPRIGSSNSDIANGQNEYPFCFGIGYNDSPILTIVTDSTSESHTFKIIEIIEGYVKTIDSKYLPTSGGASDFIIHGTTGEGNISMTSYTKMNVDKTVAEVMEAINADKRVVLDFTTEYGSHYIAPMNMYSVSGTDVKDIAFYFCTSRVQTGGTIETFVAEMRNNGYTETYGFESGYIYING